MARSHTFDGGHFPRLLQWLTGLDLFVALGALGGGAALVAAPDGSLLGMPTSLLAHTPFSSFLVPGALLLVVVGGTALVAGVAHLFRARVAGQLSLLAGVTLVAWIAVQMILLRSVHWLQLSYLAMGVLQIVLALTALGRAARGAEPAAR